MLEAIIAFVVQLWGIALLGFGAYVLFKRYSKKQS
jgi:type IV secretory pathway TrbD component